MIVWNCDKWILKHARFYQNL